MSHFKFRVPNFTRQNPPASSIPEEAGFNSGSGAGAGLGGVAASPTISNTFNSKFRVNQFVRESKHVENSGKHAQTHEAHKKSATAVSPGTTEAAIVVPLSERPDAAVPGSPDIVGSQLDEMHASDGGTLAPPTLGHVNHNATSEIPVVGLMKAKARRSLPNLKLIPPNTHLTPILPLLDAGPVDKSRSPEWNRVVRAIQGTSLEDIVKRLLDALGDHPESGPGTLVAHLGNIFLDEAVKQGFGDAFNPNAPSAGPSRSVSISNGLSPALISSSVAPSANLPPLLPKQPTAPTPTAAVKVQQRRSLPGAIQKTQPGIPLAAQKLFEPREYQPNHPRKLKRKSDADKDGPNPKPIASIMKRNSSATDLSHMNINTEFGMGGEPPVKRKRGRPKGSTKAAIQEREALKMQATAAEQASEALIETATAATESVSPVLEEPMSALPTGTSIELRASSPSPRPEGTIS